MLQIDAPPVENFWLRHWPLVYSNNVSISHSFSDTTTFTAYATVNLRSLKDCLPKLNSVLTHSWPAAIDRCLLSTGRSAVNPPGAVAAVDRRDRQADGRTPDRYIDPAPHTMRAALIAGSWRASRCTKTKGGPGRTAANPALGVLNEYALYKCTHSLSRNQWRRQGEASPLVGRPKIM